jgi:hypothetical protein
MRVFDLVKCVSWNFSGANLDAWVVAQRFAFVSALSSFAHVSSVVFSP